MLNDKIAVVTGATRGIGRAIALELGKQGATVIGTATSESGAGQISAYLAEAGLKGKGIVLNVTDAAQTDHQAEAMLDCQDLDLRQTIIIDGSIGHADHDADDIALPLA